ncbi:ABC transporter permease [Geodermatophilus sp. SYSU D00691]
MLWITLRGLFAHRFRLFATALAITLGVAFTAGTLILTDTVARTFDNVMGEVYSGVDAVVRGEEQFEGPMNTGAQRPRVDEALVDEVRRVDGVLAAEGSVTGYARLTTATGEAIGDPAGSGPAIGLTWSDDERINPLVVTGGRAPRSADEIVVDAPSLETSGLDLGDRMTVLVQAGPVQRTVVGTIAFGNAETIGGATMAAFHPSAAQELLAEPGKWDEISVVAEDGVSQETLTARLADVLPTGVEAVTGSTVTEENQQFARDAMSFFTYFMNFFAVVALLVGAFMIFNTFSITVAQRTRQNGLLRALGATSRQVLGMVLIEALVVGVLASVLGLLAGFGIATGLKALLDALGFGIPAGGLVFAPRTVLVSLAAGILVTLFAAISPARKAGRVPPIAAMSSETGGSAGYGSLSRVVVGGISLAAGLAATLTGLFADVGNRWLVIGLGCAGVFLGVYVLGRTVSLPLSRVIGAPLRRVRGVPGELAGENAMRNPKRTAAAGTALMLGVGIVVIINIFVASTKATVDDGIDRAFAADLVVDSGASLDGGVDPSLAARLGELPEVAAVTGLRVAPVELDGETALLGAVDPATAFGLLDLQPQQGTPEDLLAPGTIAVLDETAREEGLRIGSTVPVVFPDTGPQELTVAMVYGEELEANGPIGTYVIGTPTHAANVADDVDWKVVVKKAPDVGLAEARAAVDEVAATYPGAEVMDESEFAESIYAPLDPLMALVYALLGLAIVIALLGIGNTLALSIVERTHEIGLLRAVGMTRGQLRATIRWESVIIAVQGTLVGLVLGLFLGWALTTALADDGLDVFDVPWTTLAAVVVLAGLAGMLAAVLPSRRAASLDILRAVHAE